MNKIDWSRFLVDEVITIGRQEIETEALAKMQALSTKYAMGISIDQVQLKNINPPEPVQVSFNEVNQAQQEKEKLINEARRDYNNWMTFMRTTFFLTAKKASTCHRNIGVRPPPMNTHMTYSFA